ncbi:MAG: sugar phosphate isomerase/epimerase [Bacteroidota bacterium]
MNRNTSPDRRAFIRQSLIATVGLPFLHFACNDMPQKSTNRYLDNIGLQLYTVRNQMAEDPRTTIQSLREIGYQQLELMDVQSMKQVLPLAKEAGLAVNGSFFNWNFLTGNWAMIGQEAPQAYSFENVVEDAKEAELSYLVFGYLTKGERGTIDDWKRLIDLLNAAGEKCRSAGLQLAYHNHSFEFGSVEGKVPFEMLVEGLDPDLVKFELDIFWASVGGYDPLQLINRLGKRIHLLHLKDKQKDVPVLYDEAEVPQEAFKELGNGVVDIVACMKAAEKFDVAHCHVEQDHSADPLKSVAQSIQWLNA